MKLKFNVNEIDQDFWSERALKEARLIHANKKDQHRDFWEDVLPMTKRGHAAEVYAIQFLNHKDDEDEYRDTFDVDGEPVDHKVSYSPYKLSLTLEKYEWDLNTARHRPNMAHRVYGWINQFGSDEYHLHGIWEFDKKTKKLVYNSPEVWYNI